MAAAAPTPTRPLTTREGSARAGRSTILHDPVTRVGGGLGVRVETQGSTITDAHVSGTSFRGYEPILLGRDPRDFLPLISRACGWCGSIHQTTASVAEEMAWGLRPPPMALALRGIAQATEAIWIHAAHLAVRAGPDYSAPVVRRTTPWVWDLAKRTEAPGAATHGYKTIAELMEELRYFEGKYWWNTIPAGRKVLEMINLMYGKYPHPSVLSPGGVGSTLTVGNFTYYYTRLYQSVDYVKQVIAIWDDLVDFLYAADPRFAEQGERPASFIHAGAWDHDAASGYDGSWAGLDNDGRRRLAPPGVMLDGRLATGRLSEVNAGVEESVAHSFYSGWESSGGTDPSGGALSSGHPWNKTTIAAPAPRDFAGAYSWCTAPRWQGNVVESTPLGRLWLTAQRTDFPPNDYIEPTGTSVRILVPENFLPETIVEWHIPKRVNTLERLRADAYGVAFSGLCAALCVLDGFTLMRHRRTDVSHGFTVPKGETAGVGLLDSGRGMNAHYLRTDGKRRISTMQVVGPSTWNASPRDATGQPGPLEEALIGTPIIEEPADGRLTGIDAIRTIHGFDPCMHCGTH
ncbi:MAG TPA: nickel-dependent hydrogenase large subunit [Egibacteraceae bacterium]|jgi:hydrogenase large subunit|nr:nickel-dependent hydrogenase large subunit [Egibacteraceae bacterium]